MAVDEVQSDGLEKCPYLNSYVNVKMLMWNGGVDGITFVNTVFISDIVNNIFLIIF